MKAAFRVDASNDIGTGHVIRCLTLAEELRRRNVECTFICREHVGEITPRIEEHGFQFCLISNQYNDFIASSDDVSHASWLGCDWQTDADQTDEVLKEIQPDWLIVDHYSLESRWEKSLSENYKWLMVIDDMADRQHDCDLLLDQNLFANGSVRYKDAVPDSCTKLFGPEYALLQSCYAKMHQNVIPREAPIKHLLVSFGGVDKHNLTGLTLSALEKVDRAFDCVDVVMSTQSPHYNELKNQLQRLDKFNLHSDLPSLASLMIDADLSIGASGATSWERCCLGLPTIVVTLSENQRLISQELHQMKFVKWIGDVETITIDKIRQAIFDVLTRSDIKSWSDHCMSVCSGKGASLVADRIFDISQK